MSKKSVGTVPGTQPDAQFEKSWLTIQRLVTKFSQNLPHYLSHEYQEAEVRQDFIDKFFKALGWDVDHELQHDPYRREVRIEKSDRKTKGRADYAFSVAPHYNRTRFLVEAKRPQTNIITPDNCFQVLGYSWPIHLPIAVLTDFNCFHVIDCRFRPNIDSATSRVIKSWHHSEFLNRDKFSEVYYLFSHYAVENGALENFADIELPSPQVASRQYSLFPAETRDFDEDFLIKLDEWRETLAITFKKAQTRLTGEQLTECVQRTLDRLVFIRFLEDKGIEPYPIIAQFGRKAKTQWQDFVRTCAHLDLTYNGVVFKLHPVIDSPKFDPDSAIFANICDELTDEHSPYNFDTIPIEILGRIYERFLGKVVQAGLKTVEVVQKEDVRKAGGVYYTPDYIVNYMVEQSLGPQVLDKEPDKILNLHVIDTSCGSGSFLIGTFAYLLRVLLTYWRKQKKPPKNIIEIRDGEPFLTLPYKRKILVNCIYGVDIDSQAVEVAQLSLYLKLLEEETTSTAQQQQHVMGITLLPPLTRNIVVGNSLVTLENTNGNLFDIDSLNSVKSLDFKTTFPQVFASGGFDLVIGNPPYIKEYTNREAFANVYNSPYYQGKMDIWYMFACRGLDWLKPESGTLAFIATNNWVTNAGAKRLREKITAATRIEQLIDFGDYKVFRDAGIQTMILIVRRSSEPPRYCFDYRKLDGNKRTQADAQTLLEKNESDGCAYLTPTFDRSRVPSDPLTFSASNFEALLDKIASKRNFMLNERSEVAQGIVAPQDSLNAQGRKKLDGKFFVGQGIFVLSDDEKQALKLNKSELELMKPYFTSEELGCYYGSSDNKLWVIYTDSHFNDPAAMKPYPNLKRHLDRFESIITSDNHPYGLHRARNENFFTGEKIISIRKTGIPCFTYTDFPCYVSQTFNIVKTSRASLLYLTALFNSRLVRFWLRHRGKMQGQNFQVDKEPLLAIPIRVPKLSEQTRLATITQRIIDCKQKMDEALTDAVQVQLQRLIDQIEGQLQDEIENNIYGLTGAERGMLS